MRPLLWLQLAALASASFIQWPRSGDYVSNGKRRSRCTKVFLKLVTLLTPKASSAQIVCDSDLCPFFPNQLAISALTTPRLQRWPYISRRINPVPLSSHSRRSSSLFARFLL